MTVKVIWIYVVGLKITMMMNDKPDEDKIAVCTYCKMWIYTGVRVVQVRYGIFGTDSAQIGMTLESDYFYHRDCYIDRLKGKQ